MKNLHRIWPALVVLLCFLLVGVRARASVVPPKPNTPVYDGAGVLTPNQKQELNNKLIKFKQQHGPEIAVVILPTLDGEDINDVRNELFNAWGIGDKKRKDGILLLLVVDKALEAGPGASRCGCAAIETGEYVESLWTDTQTKRILSDQVLTPLIKGNFYEAVNAGVDPIIEVFTSDTQAAREYKDTADAGGAREDNSGFPWWGWLIVILALIVLQALGVPIFDVLLILGNGGGDRGSGSSGGGGNSFGGGGSSGGGGASI